MPTGVILNLEAACRQERSRIQITPSEVQSSGDRNHLVFG